MLPRDDTIERRFIFPPHPNSVAALPCKTEKPKLHLFTMSYDYFIKT